MKKIEKENKTFESIKHIDENGTEFWYAREIMNILEYSKWQNFEKIIEKARISCENSEISVFEHFTNVGKTIKMPKGEACKTHNKIGKIVRNAIQQAGGTMPEELPTPEKSLKQLEKEKNKSLHK